MRLLLFRSLWTNGLNLEAALADCETGLFDGVEGPIPADYAPLSGVPYIAEITTGGSYVPTTRDAAKHLADFQRKADASLRANPIALTILAGCDAWPLTQSVDFFGRALEFAATLGVPVSFETHRSRATFNPWITAELVRQLPALRLTCDFSHWCCVCERLVLDEEPELLALFAARAGHAHARIGYDQGPQVPHPLSPEYAGALEAHERWWDALWSAAVATGAAQFTMTPEFGPDGYLHTLPFTGTPVASLDEINRWMATRQRERFAHAALPAAA